MYVLVDDSWVETYRTTEEYDFELAAIDLYIGDYAGIGYPAAFIGYRFDGSGKYLDFDIVQGTAGLDVRGIHSMDHGNVGLPVDEPGVVVVGSVRGQRPELLPVSMLYQRPRLRRRRLEPDRRHALPNGERTRVGFRVLIARFPEFLAGACGDRVGEPLGSSRSLTTH